MIAEVGSRVFALRNTDPDTVYLYGTGIYLGHRPEPYFDPDTSPFTDGVTWRQTCEQMARDQHAGRDFEQLVTDMLATVSRDPCILLDTRQRVWGYFCYWGPEEHLDLLAAGRTVITVPVPDPPPRSLKTAKPGHGEGLDREYFTEMWPALSPASRSSIRRLPRGTPPGGT
jgi:hypothetical protein